MTGTGVRGWARFGRPAGLVEQARWLFGLAALVSLLLKLPVALLAPSVPVRFTLLWFAMAGLLAVWSYRYLTRHSPPLLDLGEATAMTALAVAFPEPAMVLSVVFGSLWFRALYGSATRVLVACASTALGTVAAIPLSAMVRGAGGATDLEVLASLPVMFLTTSIAHFLGRGLLDREQSQNRVAALVALGDRLIGLTDRESIVNWVRECGIAICVATPGLRMFIARDTGVEHRVVDVIGEFTELPDVLPRGTFVPTERARGVEPLADAGPLQRAAGFTGEWIGVQLADDLANWVVLGAPRRVPADAVVAVQAMTNQVALALRNCDAHRELAVQAHVDALTGLANRAAFTVELEKCLADPTRRAALMFLDLDDFKLVNDGMGHAAGDELLTLIARRLADAVRGGDICARLGGDEFAVLLPDADDSVVTVAQRLVDLVAAPVTLTGGTARVGASVGLAFAAAGVSGAELVQRADIAMYAAKAKGKNRVQVFDPSLLQEDGRVVFEDELAAAADAGQLVVHYQPIVSVPDGRCVAVEALVRWEHPTRGLLAPAEFISVAERTGAIVPLGVFVLRRACADAAGWRRTHPGLAVHVNVSAAQLVDAGFLDAVRRVLADFAMTPAQLVLEITESMVLDSHAIHSALDELTYLGVQLAIDDFGTGYSALTTLRTLPLSIVKIDKSFIVGSRSDEAVVEAIVHMAGRLGLRIVAEGVERVDQHRFLAGVGADSAQGYLYLRPTPAREFAIWLDRQEPTRRPADNVRELEPRRRG